MRALASVPALWALMLLPGVDVLRGLVDASFYHPEMMRISGVWSVYLLLATGAVTPVVLLLGRSGKGRGPARWLLRRRRHLGLGSFAYAALHLAHYVLEAGALGLLWREAGEARYLTGWAALAVFAALAATSNDRAVRRLGRRWKALHRWAHAAAAAVAVHWWLFDPRKDLLAWCVAAMVAAKAAQWVLRRWPRRGRAAGVPPLSPGTPTA